MSELSQNKASRVWAYMAAPNQNLPPAALITIRIDTIMFDALNEFNIATNRFTPIRAGYYLVEGRFFVMPNGLNDMYVRGYISDVPAYTYCQDSTFQRQNYASHLKMSGIYYLTPNDSIGLTCQHNDANPQTCLAAYPVTQICIHRLS